jgi:hypothetical protein
MEFRGVKQSALDQKPRVFLICISPQKSKIAHFPTGFLYLDPNPKLDVFEKANK